MYVVRFQVWVMMYIATIKTKYNTIKLEIENPNDPQFIEILEQPYVEEVRIEQKIEQLKDEIHSALSHAVGTSYYNQIAQEKSKELQLLLSKK